MNHNLIPFSPSSLPFHCLIYRWVLWSNLFTPTQDELLLLLLPFAVHIPTDYHPEHTITLSKSNHWVNAHRTAINFTIEKACSMSALFSLVRCRRRTESFKRVSCFCLDVHAKLLWLLFYDDAWCLPYSQSYKPLCAFIFVQQSISL